MFLHCFDLEIKNTETDGKSKKQTIWEIKRIANIALQNSCCYSNKFCVLRNAPLFYKIDVTQFNDLTLVS